MASRVIPFAQHTAASNGEQVPLTAVSAGLSAQELVAELHIQSAAGNYSYISVYDVATGVVLKDLYPAAVNASSVPVGPVESFVICSGRGDEDGVDPAKFGVMFQHSGDKWNAFAVVR